MSGLLDDENLRLLLLQAHDVVVVTPKVRMSDDARMRIMERLAYIGRTSGVQFIMADDSLDLTVMRKVEPIS